MNNLVKVLGMEHPDALISTDNLAAVLSHQGKCEEAEQMYRERLGSKQNVLGMEHLDTLMSMYDLANLLSSQSRFIQAVTFFEKGCGWVYASAWSQSSDHHCLSEAYSSLRQFRYEDRRLDVNH